MAVVDDDQMYLRSIQRIIRTSSQQVDLRVFDRAVPAIESLIAQPADLVLLDVFLPDLSGIEVCRILKSASASSVILVSSHLSGDVRALARDAGADEMLPKPYDLSAVLQRCQVASAATPTDRSQVPQLLSIDHLSIARNIARSLARRYRAWLSEDDVEGLALLGLCEAAVRYDPERNGLFIAFAERRVRGAILDAVRKLRLERERDLPREALHLSSHAVAPVGSRDQEGGTVVELISDEPSSEVLVAKQQLSRALSRARQHLSPAEAQVIHRRYDLGRSIAAIAAELKISLRQATALHARGLAKLQRYVA